MAYPFPEDRLPAPEWFKANVPAKPMPVADLTPTQYYVRIDRLQWLHEGHGPEGEDIPHVVTWQGKTYLFDGHHRWMLATLDGKPLLWVRNFIMDDIADVARRMLAARKKESSI